MARKAMVSWEEELAAAAAAEAAAEHAGGGAAAIGIRGGTFKLNGNDLGDQLDVVVVAHNVEYAYYDSAYDPDNPNPPACFAIVENGLDESEMYPSELSPAVQSEDGPCKECWANEWGSSERGTGKACKNSRRLAVLAVGEDGVVAGEMPLLRIPPTSLNHWASYLKRVASTMYRPTWAVATSITFDESADYERLQFSTLRTLTKEECDVVVEQKELAEEMIYAEFDVSGYEDPESKRAARKKRAPATKKKATAKKKTATRRSKMS